MSSIVEFWKIVLLRVYDISCTFTFQFTKFWKLIQKNECDVYFCTLMIDCIMNSSILPSDLLYECLLFPC